MTSSRFVRPDVPARQLSLQPRDQAAIAAVNDYRVLYGRHLRMLHYPATSLRRVQARLRLLWEHRILERYYRPVLFMGGKPETLELAYGRGPASASLIVNGEVLGPCRQPSPMTFEHALAVADVLTAVVGACRSRSDLGLVAATPEAPLWRGLKLRSIAPPYLVPDGSVTLRYPSGETLTYYIEIVRADVKGGNGRLRKKMEEYVRLNRAGRFRELYGHEQLRAILFLTTSAARAEHFRRLAATLPHGRRLFWFGSYQAIEADGRVVPGVTASGVLEQRWRTADSSIVSFLEPTAHATPPTTPSDGATPHPR